MKKMYKKAHMLFESTLYDPCILCKQIPTNDCSLK